MTDAMDQTATGSTMNSSGGVSVFTAKADLSLRELERRYIRQVMAESRTLAEAAARLGIDNATLWRKRKEYGIT